MTLPRGPKDGFEWCNKRHGNIEKMQRLGQRAAYDRASLFPAQRLAIYVDTRLLGLRIVKMVLKRLLAGAAGGPGVVALTGLILHPQSGIDSNLSETACDEIDILFV